MAFRPEELIFAPTGQCNLHCAHCRVTRTRGTLRAEDAIALMESCRPHGLDRLGFSGGEPFLEPEFLYAVTAAAIRLDFVFDRLMTNAVWYRDEAHLRVVLGRLCDAGFDGTFGLSIDSYHGQEVDRLLPFFRTAYELRGRKDCVEISWVDSGDDAALFGKFAALAEALGGELSMEDGLPRLISARKGLASADTGTDTDADADAGFGDPSSGDAGFDDREALSIPFVRIPYSPPSREARWDDSRWFDDDFCEGPGNVFYVHPDGRIAVCCGFGNENPELVTGRLGVDDYDSLMRSALANPHITACYVAGLATTRKKLEKKGIRFPGKLLDPCVFCDHLCSQGTELREEETGSGSGSGYRSGSGSDF